MTAVSQTGTAPRPTALFVLGMSRSGTSALTRMLALCGGALPTGMVGGFTGNPRGYWEPRKVVHLNEAILRRHDTTAYDPSLRLQEEGALDIRKKAASIAKIRTYLTTLTATPLVVIKHPTISILSDMWFEAARLAGFDIVTVIAVRHPQEVIASNQRLGRSSDTGTSPQLVGALWLKYSLLAENHTRGVPRVFVEYTNLLDDWRGEVERVSAALPLPVDLNARDEGAIDNYLERDLRHERCVGPVQEYFGTNWISTAYEALSAAARDEPWDESALDRVYEAYRASEHGFRTAFGDFQRTYQIHRYAPVLIGRLASELLAVTHLRRGTWA